MSEVVVGLPLLPWQRSVAAGSAVLGLGALAGFALTSDQPLGVLAGALFFASFFGLGTWFLGRPAQERRLKNVIRSGGPEVDRTGRAVLGGLLTALFVGVGEAALLGGFALLWGVDQVRDIGGGILLGLALQFALTSRDLDGWQRETGQAVFTAGAPSRWLSVGRAGRGRLVAVSAASASLEPQVDA